MLCMSNLKKFEKRLRKRLNNGIEDFCDEYALQLYFDLSAKRGFTQEGHYFGSKPGQSPALFEAWFTDNLAYDTDDDAMEGRIGFTHKHAAQVYRMLIRGTDEVEPRRGPEVLFNDIKDILADAFTQGFCADPGGDQNDESGEEIPF